MRIGVFKRNQEAFFLFPTDCRAAIAIGSGAVSDAMALAFFWCRER